jgi:quercetin 2,3-dioxygenase
MCDFFGPMASTSLSGVDEYPVGWHPHRGFDLVTYITEGVGRHADSMGNRETFSAPGMQWCSAGSGIEHAEAGGTPPGQNMTGFQIWVNVPSARKMDDPRYGTVPAEDMPLLSLPDGVVARVLAGPLGDVSGPFKTVQDVSMVHYEVPAGKSVTHTVPTTLDNALIYVFKGSVDVESAPSGKGAVMENQVARFDASSSDVRTISLAAGSGGASVLLFAGKMLKQPIAWQGPVVMTTREEVEAAFMEMRRGKFPPVRAPWDYRRLAAFPADHPARKELSA